MSMKLLTDFVKAFFLTLTISVVCLIASQFACAGEFKLMEFQELSIDYKNFALLNKNNYDSLLYPEAAKESLNVNIKTNFLNYAYWDSTIESMTTDKQYRSIGLETRVGLRLHSTIDLGLYHHSEHLIDRAHSFMSHFPVLDAIEFKLYLFRKQKTDTLF